MRPNLLLLCPFLLALFAAAPATAGVLEDRAIEDLVRRSFVLHRVVADPSMVQVFVSRGVVELRGQVAHEEERRLLGDAIARTFGVARLENRLFVDSPERRLSARWKADRLRSHLVARGDVELAPFVVSAADETIDLGGTVRSAEQRDAIGRIATAFAAPLPVRNRIEVNPGTPIPVTAVDDASIGALVREALEGVANAQLAADGVRSEAGQVVLAGTVARDEDVARAGALAAGVRGVRAVDNRLSVRR